MPEHMDKKLAQRVWDGDEHAFESFFRTYHPRLYRFALVRLNNDEDLTQEVVQAALCKAISKLDSYRGEAALFTWLCTFCRHEISAQLKTLSRYQGQALCEDDPSVRAALESLSLLDGADPGASLAREDVARIVRVTLDHLPRLYSDALELKYVHELSVKEIAARMDKRPKAVESTLTRARQAFKDGLSSVLGRDSELLGGHPMSIANE